MISLNCTLFHILAYCGAVKYVLLILITHKVGTCWHSGHWEIFTCISLDLCENESIKGGVESQKKCSKYCTMTHTSTYFSSTTSLKIDFWCWTTIYPCFSKLGVWKYRKSGTEGERVYFCYLHRFCFCIAARNLKIHQNIFWQSMLG